MNKKYFHNHNTNITKIFEISKLFQTFLKIFCIYRFNDSKNFHDTNITKISEISKFISTFLKYFLYVVQKL